MLRVPVYMTALNHIVYIKSVSRLAYVFLLSDDLYQIYLYEK